MKRIIFALAVLLLLVARADAIPPVAAEFSGIVIIDGKLAPPGTRVEIRDSNNTLCGSTIVNENGRYGLVSCQGDVESTEIDEGAELGEGLSFYVEGKRLFTHESVKWKPGMFAEVNLVVGDVEKGMAKLEKPGLLPVFALVGLLAGAFAIFVLITSLIVQDMRRMKLKIKRLEGEE